MDSMDSFDRKTQLYDIVVRYREELQKKIQEREEEMKSDSNDHYMISPTNEAKEKWVLLSLPFAP